jgi:SAM-dependent methyltransferase
VESDGGVRPASHRERPGDAPAARSVRERGLVCPACRTPLGPPLACSRCGRCYHRVAGIPDLRLADPDQGLSRSEDVRRALEVDSIARELGFEQALRRRPHEGRPPRLVERTIAIDLAGLSRAEEAISAVSAAEGGAVAVSGDVLEVGCGMAALAARAAHRARRVVASDIRMRSVVLARQRLAEAGTGSASLDLVCCSGEDLPFEPESFDLVLAGDVIEHVANQARFVDDCHRVLRPGGMLFMSTPNRWSLGLEPHVRLWGVGLLPRRLARRYVQRVRGTSYDGVHLLSGRGLRRLLEARGFAVELVPPRVPAALRDLYNLPESALIDVYERLRRFGPARPALLAVGPFFHAFARKTAR